MVSDEFLEANGLSPDPEERDLSNSTIDSDASGQPESLEADDPDVAASVGDDGAVHSGFVTDDGGVTNENVNESEATVFEPTGSSFEPTDQTVDESAGVDSSGPSTTSNDPSNTSSNDSGGPSTTSNDPSNTSSNDSGGPSTTTDSSPTSSNKSTSENESGQLPEEQQSKESSSGGMMPDVPVGVLVAGAVAVGAVLLGGGD
jgi:cobalamin biosynthesis Mg chelatase CobN